MTGLTIQVSIRACLLGVTLAALPTMAPAQSPTKAQQDAIRSNCRSDFMKNCSSVPPGGREALECLMKNKANVSSGCQGALNAVAAPAAAKPEPKPEPKPEMKAEPAAPVPTPPPAAAAPHSPQPPKAATPAVPQPAAPKAANAPARPAAPPPAESAPPAAVAPATEAPKPMRIGEALVIRRYCANDFRVLCKGVPIGQGRAVKCLADNRPALSPGCKKAMENTGH